MSVVSKSFPYGPHTVTIETGELARQADGAVRVSMGETVVLVTAVAKTAPTPGRDFFPLTVNYIEKTYAAGRIPGGFFKREGRPTEKETLNSRLIDRPIRPLFPDGFLNDVQVVATVLSMDPDIDADIPGAARRLGGAGALGHPVQRADRRRPRRLEGRQVPPQPDRQGSRRIAAAPGGRRYRACRAHGRVRGQGPVRRGHARRRWCSATSRCRSRSAPSRNSPPRPASRAGSGKPAADNAELNSAVSLHAQAAIAQAYSITEKQQRHTRLGEIKTQLLDDARRGRGAEVQRRAGRRTRCSSSRATSSASAS